MILTVTLNPALDRTMIVPNFQPGLRHRATDTVMQPGGKGINVARTAKTLGRPVIATGFIGGRKGDQIVADINDEGILCDFVRVRGESRISTAVIDPDTNVVTEINEQGPEITPEELDMLHEKLEYLGKSADLVVFAGSVPPGLPDDCYGTLISHAADLGLVTMLYTYADPLRLGIKARPDYVFPKLVEAEKVIGYEFAEVEDRIKAAHTIRAMGAGSAVITYRYGCVAVMADGEESRTYIGELPDVDVVSPLGWDDSLAAGFAVRLLEGASTADCLRYAMACGAADLVKYGAGMLWSADVERLLPEVVLEEVTAVEL
ncbi:MAG: 1-phosphofructokinase family hexose kinase [Actinobacteria bacterium]|jgi:1-phosphofructokinase/tagatose 6-phosphate kinase|nr:1-phosphofructokinase family hexose kinase [Actinomycetota bacterium]